MLLACSIGFTFDGAAPALNISQVSAAFFFTLALFALQYIFDPNIIWSSNFIFELLIINR